MVAAEGMWLPMLIERLNYTDMQKQGLHLTAEEIYSINHSSLKDAIVMINDGDCTGFMVSKNGMMMTNHHCALDYLQSHADDENNYIKQGFWAASKFEELRTEHLSVSFLIRIENKTKEILSQLTPMMSEAERKDKIDQIIMRIEGREEDENPGLDVRVMSFYNGNEFYMFVYETYSDVRIVGIPPESVGVFGADSDNWSWPRHTGDFAFLRVYMSPQGKPASYNMRNVPYQPKKHLPISLKGVQKDDFAMILGYPGSTDRFITSYGVQNIVDKLAPSVVDVRDKKMAVLKQDMQKDEVVQMKYISKYNHTSNYWKYFKEQREILQEMGVYEQKKQEEAAFVQWINEEQNRQAKYAEALPLIEKAYKEIDRLTVSRYYYNEIIRRGVDAFSLVRSFNPLKAELSKRVVDKEEVERKALGLRYTSGNFYKSYQKETDRELFAALMQMYFEKVPKDQQPSFFLSRRPNF